MPTACQKRWDAIISVISAPRMGMTLRLVFRLKSLRQKAQLPLSLTEEAPEATLHPNWNSAAKWASTGFFRGRHCGARRNGPSAPSTRARFYSPQQSHNKEGALPGRLGHRFARDADINYRPQKLKAWPRTRWKHQFLWRTCSAIASLLFSLHGVKLTVALVRNYANLSLGPDTMCAFLI